MPESVQLVLYGMAYLAAISTATTIPLFIRTRGNVQPLSFPVVSSLSTVHLFASELKSSLLSCSTSGVQVVWKTFHNSITLILVVSDDAPSELHSTYLLDVVFGAMVLLIGLHELEDVSNKIERLKKELKCCYPLIDHILQGSEDGLMSLLTQCPDVFAVDNKSIIEKTLEGFVEVAQSSYGCVMVHRRLYVATESWWGLSSLELCIISMLLSSLPPSLCRDIPIYLPKASNKVAHRLIVLTLLEGVELCVLCDSDPPLPVLQENVEVYWSSVEHQFRNSCLAFPRCMSLSLKFDQSVLALCLVNLDKRKSLTCLSPSSSNQSRPAQLTAGFQGEMDTHKRHVYLTRFYKTAVGNLLPISPESSDQDERYGLLESLSLKEVIPHKISETYTCAKHYKAYAMHRNDCNLFILFDTSTPTFAMRQLTEQLFQTLVEEHCLL